MLPTGEGWMVGRSLKMKMKSIHLGMLLCCAFIAGGMVVTIRPFGWLTMKILNKIGDAPMTWLLHVDAFLGTLDHVDPFGSNLLSRFDIFWGYIGLHYDLILSIWTVGYVLMIVQIYKWVKKKFE